MHAQTVYAVKPKEVACQIKTSYSKKSVGTNLISEKLLKEIPRKIILLMTHIFNAIIRIAYWPKWFKKAQIKIILKPGKDPTEVSFYRPISLLPIISRILEKILNKIG